MGVAVNQLPIRALRDALALLPRFPTEAAEKIAELRPFASLEDLLRKVNGAIMSIQNRVSAKAAKQLSVVPVDHMSSAGRISASKSKCRVWA